MHRIRPATVADAPALLAVYSPYVTDTAISFELEPPTLEASAARIKSISQRFPYLVYEIDGEAAGFAYASPFAERGAYRFHASVSVYLNAAYHGHGVAPRLYSCLLAILERQGYYNVYAGISGGNARSIRFHEKLGFEHVATFPANGYKLGAWHDVVWLEKQLRPLDHPAADPLPIGDVPQDWLEALYQSQLR